jgi:hypothetical protein
MSSAEMLLPLALADPKAVPEAVDAGRCDATDGAVVRAAIPGSPPSVAVANDRAVSTRGRLDGSASMTGAGVWPVIVWQVTQHNVPQVQACSASVHAKCTPSTNMLLNLTMKLRQHIGSLQCMRAGRDER